MVEQVNDTNIQSAPALSVVVPVHNEVENIEPLIAEIMATLEGVERYEIIYINDCSRDSTLERLTSLDQKFKVLRVLTHQKRSGQSAAIRTGVKAARGDLIATLDGDGQNDPEDIPKLLKAYREQAVADARILIAGFRARRQDSFIKRLSSKIANGIRSSLLGDATPDTGCGLKIFRREDFFDL
ncbi:MAG: glycosyltransferase family 2 protein, partial [Rhodospirillales bacterium]|nr:glycosyltransferase family 2 protein [Rhodospirillales bacterium]